MDRSRTLIISVAIAAFLLVMGPTAVGAGERFPELTGAVTCEEGDAVIDWTITNFFPSSIELSDGTMTIDDGAPVELTFSPNPLVADGTSTAQATVSGTEIGTAEASVTLALQGPEEITGTVELEGCPQPETTTSTVAPTTTAAAAPSRAQPTFTG
jgi:hypothetical protein